MSSEPDRGEPSASAPLRTRVPRGQTLPERPLAEQPLAEQPLRMRLVCGAARLLGDLDRWAAEHPAHPRVVPWAVYVTVMVAAVQIRDWNSWAYVPCKAVQVLAVLCLVWRFRRLVPEITLRFHWAILPVSMVLTVCWISLNGFMISTFPSLSDPKPGFFETLKADNEMLFWVAAIAHLIAMCSAVPLVEEVFNRSLVLRMASDSRGLRSAMRQLVCELPVIGERVRRSVTKRDQEYQRLSSSEQFYATPLGKLTFPGVVVSTGLFMLAHATADWPGAVLCGVVWCVLLQRTRRLGLGPVIWSHALVNALLWIYVMNTESFSFI
jgi:hypothetical protein